MAGAAPRPGGRPSAPPSARLGRLGIVHPFPSTLVALATGILTLLAGGTELQALQAVVAMAGFQASIGAVNDLADRDADAVGQPWKPIPSGRVSVATARLVAAGAMGIGIVASLMLGLTTLVVGLLGYGLGVLYDLRAKQTGWGWLCLALALPLVPVFAWQAAGAGLPPGVGWLIVLGSVAGVELAVANGLVDARTDAAGGHAGQGVVARLGPRRARLAMIAAGVALLALAWGTLLGGAGGRAPTTGAGGSTGIMLAALVGSGLLLVGLAASAVGGPRAAWSGWHLQAVGVAVFAVAWLVSLV